MLSWRARWAGFLLGSCLLGCNRTAPYAALFQEQLQAQKDLVEILRPITDQASMEKARAELQRRHGRYEEIRKKAQALPAPNQAMLGKIQEDLGAQMELSVGDLQREVRRILDLPGGRDFLAGLGKLHK